METQAQRVYKFILNQKRSAGEITSTLFIGDPRSVIRDLREKGIKVYDEVKRNRANNGRYKLYWIDPNDNNPEL